MQHLTVFTAGLLLGVLITIIVFAVHNCGRSPAHYLRRIHVTDKTRLLALLTTYPQEPSALQDRFQTLYARPITTEALQGHLSALVRDGLADVRSLNDKGMDPVSLGGPDRYLAYTLSPTSPNPTPPHLADAVALADCEELHYPRQPVEARAEVLANLMNAARKGTTQPGDYATYDKEGNLTRPAADPVLKLASDIKVYKVTGGTDAGDEIEWLVYAPDETWARAQFHHQHPACHIKQVEVSDLKPNERPFTADTLPGYYMTDEQVAHPQIQEAFRLERERRAEAGEPPPTHSQGL